MIEYFSTAVSLVKNALDLIRSSKDLLPDSKKSAVETAIHQAEESLKIAEARAAEEMGYYLCKCTWPPQIALREPNGAHRCPNCHRDVSEDFRPITPGFH